MVYRQMVLTTFEPHKRWKQFRHKEEEPTDEDESGFGEPFYQEDE